MQLANKFPTTIPSFTDAFLRPESLLVKIFTLGLFLIAIMYVVYAFVIVRQVKIMNKTITTPLGPTIQVLAWLHMLIAIVFAAGILFFL